MERRSAGAGAVADMHDLAGTDCAVDSSGAAGTSAREAAGTGALEAAGTRIRDAGTPADKTLDDAGTWIRTQVDKTQGPADGGMDCTHWVVEGSCTRSALEEALDELGLVAGTLRLAEHE